MQDQPENNQTPKNAWLSNLLLVMLALGLVVGLIYFTGKPETQKKVAIEVIEDKSILPEKKEKEKGNIWEAPDKDLIDEEPNAELLHYGRKLIASTSVYLGPRGSVAQISNGMNCQNCHLEAGTKAYANNYGVVASFYPKFRERSGKTESVYKRVHDCFERSLNGKAPDSASKEMQAIVAYVLWVGKDVQKGEKPDGAGLKDLTFLERAANPEKGKNVYATKCQSCHAENGEGQMAPSGIAYVYPPLWGAHSYNTGAGLYRLSRFAAYVKTSMPQGASYKNPQLSDEEAWDVAAFVNSQPRPKMNLSKDWPKISGKPVDHPFGPFADRFSEKQHKYGPFGPIAAARKGTEKNKR